MDKEFLEDDDSIEIDESIEEVEDIEINEDMDFNDVEDVEIDQEESNKEYKIEDSNVYYPNFLFAGFGIRAIAFIIDSLVIFALSKIISDVLGSFIKIYDSGLFFSVYNLIHLSIYLGYFIFMTKFTNGQTLGKMVMGLRVVSLHEEKLSWATILTREFLGRFILKRLQFLYIISIFSMEKQQLADILANTSVVREGYLLEYKKLEDLNKEINFS